LKIAHDGRPAIAYKDSKERRLKYAVIHDGEWRISTVEDDKNAANGYTSLAFSPAGDPAIGYFGGNDADLKYAELAPLIP
jgi:hypothetical protein